MVTIGSTDLDGPRSVDSGYGADGDSFQNRRRDAGHSTRATDLPPSTTDGPRAIQVIETDEENHTFSLNEEALSSILLRPDVACRKVAVISVAGAFRKGKSFLLNFFLRYMQNFDQEEQVKGCIFEKLQSRIKIFRKLFLSFQGDWLGEDNGTLQGFSWRGGCERETSGILLWSEPFFVRLPSGEKVSELSPYFANG